MNSISIFSLIFTCLFFLNACGNNSGGGNGSGNGSQQENSSTDEYRIVFQALNANVGNHNSFGTASLRFLPENKFKIVINMLGLPSGVTHRQFIHEGSECPTSADDSSADGVIDHVEAFPVIGASLMALDGDLSSQDPAGATFPSGSSYSYEKETEIQNLPSGLYLDQKIVVIYGVNTQVPAETRSQIPVACGKIIPVADF